MICEYCGAELAPGAKFCGYCGMQSGSPKGKELVPVNSMGPELSPSSVLTWGIVATAFACTFILSFLGIIFGVIGLKKAKTFLAIYGPDSKQVRIGHTLSKVGIIAGSILTVLCLLYFAFMIFAIMYY